MKSGAEAAGKALFSKIITEKRASVTKRRASKAKLRITVEQGENLCIFTS